MKQSRFSFFRLWAVIIKEFIQMRRDRGTFAMMVGLPLLQVILFGFAINSDPKHLVTAVVSADDSPFVRTLTQGMQNSGYFDIQKKVATEKQADALLAKGAVQFIVNIPSDFTRQLLRGERGKILLEADATDPGTTGNAIAAMHLLGQNVFRHDFIGPLHYLQTMPSALQVIVHPKYNPAIITQYNIVTGLLGVVLTMTMTMTTSIALTRERDRGTMESLLATPLHPLEIMVGKILPYIMVGYIQCSIVLIIGKLLFSIPFLGNIFLLYLLALPFIAANLAVGITISTLAKNPLQAVQMAVFFFLPSIVLSGFMFPFRGMPPWAQHISAVLPLTHFLPIVRGILIKGNGFLEVWPQLAAIVIFLFIVMALGVKRFRRTLD